MECTRKFAFDAAHRILGYQGKCYKLHGHRYELEITFTAKTQDDLGILFDFAIMKEIFGKWIDDNFDHNAILAIGDKELGDFITKTTQQKIYYIEQNPTAENIAKHLMYDIFPGLLEPYETSITKLTLYETPNCFVTLYAS